MSTAPDLPLPRIMLRTVTPSPNTSACRVTVCGPQTLLGGQGSASGGMYPGEPPKMDVSPLFVAIPKSPSLKFKSVPDADGKSIIFSGLISR
eukprot:CAMPEP_0172906268 /NCGR_PEP_ID=MMETSP1075-20121228/176456_1 /TAXON_ID=2916 /ORGANISM="Ceratium fusus, Strain PA161109" /LENGTH=91 /DNA_ID=CAMNT_0013763661 /DNA_START=279 /DNA_END=554 /DNA_ORIENTATION=+